MPNNFTEPFLFDKLSYYFFSVLHKRAKEYKKKTQENIYRPVKYMLMLQGRRDAA